METYHEILELNRRGKTKYCENECCENEAVTKVRVSMHRTGDSVRHFCAPCAEAYTIGVQHGTFRTRTELRKERASKNQADKEKQGARK